MIHLYAISILVSQLKLSDNMSRSDSRRRRGRSCSILPISHYPLILYMTFKGFKSNSQEGVLKETRHVVINPNLAAVSIAGKDPCSCTQTYRGKRHRFSRGHVANTRCEHKRFALRSLPLKGLQERRRSTHTACLRVSMRRSDHVVTTAWPLRS